MGWLTKFFRGSTHNISEGQYHSRLAEDTAWNEPSSSPVVTDIFSEFNNEDIDRAIALSLSEEEQRKAKTIDKDMHLEEDEQLARAIQESLNVESPPRRNGSANGGTTYHLPRETGNGGNAYQPSRENGSANGGNAYHPLPFMFSSGFRACAGCHREIGHGRFLSCMGAVWHPECFRCHACSQPIYDYEFSMSGNHPYHKTCYKEQFHPKCDVCKQFIPTNMNGLIEYRAHPFWLQKYCPSHEVDGTPRCCSCERMEPRESRYVLLDDGRKLCLECLDSAVMDTNECQPLYLEIQEFYEGLNMKVEQQVPLLLVERQALNEAMEGEKAGHHHLPETRGLCLSEEQTVSTILRRPRMAGNKIMGMITEPYRLTRRCEVTAILILYGLPRLLTGSILAHEMMHAWLRLKGYRTLSPDVEEGICQVLAHLWIESEIMAGSGSGAASSSSGSSSSMSSKKAGRSQFEHKLGDFFKHQIETDTSMAYGEGFRAGNRAVLQYGLKRTLEHIRLTGTFPF
ncbi:hypothetical protein BDA96_10G077500 [Sorghum bicolor]|uniref:LIM zinc-binding domain-containing protein n=1 Tax=Sorghum bicolor TaxID=4558 RepID=A0A921Q3J5_SORBI|nr:hypothetical protein BDA96_10G077500 [Sorghum bicolor]KAG0513157.1 hypothetical protein BDA96_10G077500 [Sorghum bicolor]